MTDANGSPSQERKRKRRWGDAPPSQVESAMPPAAEDAKAKALALKESVAARLAALKAKKHRGHQLKQVYLL
jgi:hypothetical protein